MDNWAEDELVLPEVPPAYFTTPSNLLPSQPVSEQMRKDLTALPASVAEVDMLVCDSFPRPPGDVSLWFSLRYAEATTDALRQALAGGGGAANVPHPLGLGSFDVLCSATSVRTLQCSI